jgi:Domain of unknown function (DUF4290)
MNRLDIAYNTDRDDVRYPEYGRTIHQLLHHAKSIEERPKRQKTVEAIIQMMAWLAPGNTRHTEEFRDKLWNHAFVITNYELDVTPPPYVVIRTEADAPVARSLTYPAVAQRFRHYGNNIQTLIAKAIAMEEGPKKEGFVEVIASYMKLAYKTWNREHYVSDDAVKDDLEILSDGQLALHEGHSSLDTLSISASRRDREQQQQNMRNRNNNKSNNNKGGGSSKNNKYGNNKGGGMNKRKK